jgi:molybdate transport system substrate-binding protein
VKRVAVGKPKSVPAGEYAAEVFDSLKIAEAVKGKLVYGANVRQVLDYVRRGEVDAGVVYATDAAEAGDGVTVVATAPEGSHRPIEYVGAVITGAKHAGAAGKFLEYLTGDAGRGALGKRGFGAPGAAGSR